MVSERPTSPAFEAETAMAFGSSHAGSFDESGTRARAGADAGTISTGNSGAAGVGGGSLTSMETSGMASTAGGLAVPVGGCAARSLLRYSNLHWSNCVWDGLLPVSL